MDPAEVEFMGESSPIEIIPSFRGARVYLISGEVGPFEAGVSVSVPAWMACSLRRRRLCRVVPPAWLCVEQLEEVLEREQHTKLFTEMPSEHYIVVTKLLLDVAAEDIPQSDKIRTLVKDIWDVRMAKLRTSMAALLKAGGNYGRLDHLTLMEVNAAKPLLPSAMDQLYRLQKNAQAGENASTSSLSMTYLNSSSLSGR